MGAPHASCGTCSTLHDHESAGQKYGWPEDDTFLPPAVGKLEVVRDLAPGGARDRELRRCPECGTFYLYATDYEYLVNGSEDEQTLTRISTDEGNRLLEG